MMNTRFGTQQPFLNRFQIGADQPVYSPLLGGDFKAMTSVNVPNLQYAQAAKNKQPSPVGGLLGDVGKSKPPQSIDPENITMGKMEANLPWLKNPSFTEAMNDWGKMDLWAGNQAGMQGGLSFLFSIFGGSV